MTIATPTSPSHHAPAVTNRRTGAVHRWSETLIPTLREAPAEATTPSHVLLLRAGYIRQVAAGVYTFLPLAWRVLDKVTTIVREEMDAAGARQLHMPAFVPFELYKDTKRDEAYGDLLFRLKDRKGNDIALGPTHEETITDLVRQSITSYKQLPINLYQVQTKYRDEARPRAGLLRGREFVMKDAYSFHTSVDGPGGLGEAYDAMYQAYVNIFTRCGLSFTAVEAEAGPIGGSASHEFMVNAESGEDTILVCEASGYAANVEKAEIGERSWSFDGAPAAPLEKVHTPNLPGIDGVAQFLKTTPDGMLKTIVFEVLGPKPGAAPSGPQPKWLLACVRGDHEVNEGKVRDVSGWSIALADDKAARAAGFAIGYVSPLAATKVPGTLMLVDPDAAQGGIAWCTGSDEPDHHVRSFNWSREMGAVLSDAGRVSVADIRNAQAGDPSPRAKGSKLTTRRGIEVGHIFKLGTKYSEAMGLTVLDEKQQKRSVVMGCYGIGVSRTLAACVEMSHDAGGIVWPAAVAPYHVEIVVMKPDDETQSRHAREIAAALAERGADVLIDDRDERPGPKFKDADLIGIPVRLTLGDKALAEGCVEFKPRTDAGKGELVKLADVIDRCLAALG
ncbi:MAG: proline--tRNA ligase [Phycisphaerales bacterium]|jgi:prolyl-tRNA synthetase|nr:proline--tRNA ligase [Phycisphaerales bacterium]